MREETLNRIDLLDSFGEDFSILVDSHALQITSQHVDIAQDLLTIRPKVSILCQHDEFRMEFGYK